MEKLLLFSTVFVLAISVSIAQPKPVKIVFDISSSDTLAHQMALRHASLMAKSYPASQFEVVIYGGALPMVVKGQSTITKGIQALEGNKNMIFKVCAITMKRYNIDISQLLPGVQVVPDGIIEIVTKHKKVGATSKKVQIDLPRLVFNIWIARSLF